MVDYPRGYTRVILRVNLTNKEIVKQKLDIDLIDKFIGGRGINGKFLYDEVKPGTDPLGPDNKVILGVGPCNGTSVPGSQRFTFTSKSPLTGFFGDSNSGGDLGAELKYAGYDIVILEGQSRVPVYLLITDENVELREAGHLWGKTTFQTRGIIEREVNDPEVCVASIGPGGENLVKFANIISELGRASGRTGIGAVLGSKKVKAIAVRGTRGVKVANYEALQRLNREDYEALRRDPERLRRTSEWGPTAAWVRYAVGMLPTRNFQQSTFEKDLFQDLVKNGYLVKQKACISCPLGCNHSYVIRQGPYIGTIGEGTETSQLGDPGPRVGNNDIGLALKASTLCDEYGIDLFDTTAMIAYAMECYENRILTTGDASGLKLDWGDAQAILSLIEMIANRKGLGDTLALGLKKAPEIIGGGSEKYAIHSKGQTLVMRNVRASKGWALMSATSSRGACHTRASLPETLASGVVDIESAGYDPGALKLVESYSDPLNPLKEEGKAELVKWYEDLRAFQNSMEICIFSFHKGVGENKSLAELMAAYYNAVTGCGITGDEVLRIGERITNLERAFNLREGLTRSDDSLPERMLKEPLPDGMGKGQVVNLEPMLDRYYELRGWDKCTGFPTRKKLLELDLAEVAEDLEKRGKLK